MTDSVILLNSCLILQIVAKYLDNGFCVGFLKQGNKLYLPSTVFLMRKLNFGEICNNSTGLVYYALSDS